MTRLGIVSAVAVSKRCARFMRCGPRLLHVVLAMGHPFSGKAEDVCSTLLGPASGLALVPGVQPLTVTKSRYKKRAG